MSRLRQYVASWLRGDLELAPITELLAIRPLEIGDGTARVELDAGPRLHNAMRTVHGGVFCDLADVAMGVALATRVADDETFSTLQLQMSYFQAVGQGRLQALAKVLRRGRSTAYLECDILDPDDQLVAKATSVCMIRVGDARS